MKNIIWLCFVVLLFMQLTLTSFAAGNVQFVETAARTGDVMTALSFVALAAIVVFIGFIVITKNRKNRDSHE